MMRALTTPSRRGLLAVLVTASAAGWAAAAAAAEACVDLDALPPGQRSMRAGLNFKLVSDDPARRCAGCSFFTAAQAGCGACQLLGGPVPAGGRCDSWAARK
jgi:hypothetical protein